MINNKNSNIVTEFHLGKTKIRICDDYCKDKSKQEIESILNRISQNIKFDVK